MAIDLEKRAETVRIILEKKQIVQPPAMRVGLALDISGSARGLYSSGVMQETVSRLLAVAMRFDDNGELDMWTFHNAFQRLASANRSNYERFVQKEILDNSRVSKWGGTSYSPVLNDVIDLYFRTSAAAPRSAGGFLGGLFGRKQQPQPSASGMPAMCMFVTDGANDDRAQAASVMRAAKDHPLYWQLVGVGDPREFGFLKSMADELPNVGFVHLPRLDISDEDLYDKLLSDELCTWVKGH